MENLSRSFVEMKIKSFDGKKSCSEQETKKREKYLLHVLGERSRLAPSS